MKIEQQEITVRDLVEGYINDLETGRVVGYGGKLDIRPPYQREFIYKDKQREAVIATVQDDFPLNVMYWSVREDGTYEIIDGQQRTISLCQYVNGEFPYMLLFFHNLQPDEQEQILNYKLTIYFCEGTDSEKLKWFKTINIAGEKLTDQELRNAVYAGSWVSDAKRYFSKTGCTAYQVGGDYLNGSAIRQDYLETAIDWINDGRIDEYMAKNQHVQNANELWLFFQSVIEWVKATFPVYRKEMKGLRWGGFYNRFKDKFYDTAALEEQIKTLMADDDVTSKKGIYEYVLTGEERCLNLRAFTDTMKRSAYERQVGICPKCGRHFAMEQMEGDHMTPWHEGAKRHWKTAKCYARTVTGEKRGNKIVRAAIVRLRKT